MPSSVAEGVMGGQKLQQPRLWLVAVALKFQLPLAHTLITFQLRTVCAFFFLDIIVVRVAIVVAS